MFRVAEYFILNQWQSCSFQSIVAAMSAFGHQTQEFNVGGSVVCAVAETDHEHITANSDFRKAGHVDGFERKV